MKIIAPKRRNTKKRGGRSRKGEGSVFLRGATYWYKIPTAGKPESGSCETSDYEEAILFKNRRLMEVHARRRKPAGIATVNDILTDYQIYIENDRPKSYRSIRTAVKHLNAALGPIVADRLTTDDTDAYRKAREADGAQFPTVNRELGYLRAALRREMNTTPPRVTAIPFMRIPSEKGRYREGFIDREGYERILAELPEPLKAIFVCAFHTGARSGELKKIKLDQVNLRDRLIELSPKNTKNKDGRWLPIWGDMGKYLERQKEMHDEKCPGSPWAFFWIEGYHPRCAPGTQLKDFRRAWSVACERAGFPGLLFHDLRRSAIKFADQEAGISQSMTMLMSGHKTDSVFRRYNIRGGRDMKKLAETLDQHLEQRKQQNKLRDKVK